MRKILATGLAIGTAMAAAPAVEAHNFSGPDGGAPVMQPTGGTPLTETAPLTLGQKMAQRVSAIGNLVIQDRALATAGAEHSSRNSITEITSIYVSESVKKGLAGVESVYGHKGYYSLKVARDVGSGAIKKIWAQEGGIGHNGHEQPFTTLEAEVTDTVRFGESTRHRGIPGQDYQEQAANPLSGEAQATQNSFSKFTKLFMTMLRGAGAGPNKHALRPTQDERQVVHGGDVNLAF